MIFFETNVKDLIVKDNEVCGAVLEPSGSTDDSNAYEVFANKVVDKSKK